MRKNTRLFEHDGFSIIMDADKTDSLSHRLINNLTYIHNQTKEIYNTTKRSYTKSAINASCQMMSLLLLAGGLASTGYGVYQESSYNCDDSGCSMFVFSGIVSLASSATSYLFTRNTWTSNPTQPCYQLATSTFSIEWLHHHRHLTNISDNSKLYNLIESTKTELPHALNKMPIPTLIKLFTSGHEQINVVIQKDSIVDDHFSNLP